MLFRFEVANQTKDKNVYILSVANQKAEQAARLDQIGQGAKICSAQQNHNFWSLKAVLKHVFAHQVLFLTKGA